MIIAENPLPPSQSHAECLTHGGRYPISVYRILTVIQGVIGATGTNCLERALIKPNDRRTCIWKVTDN